MSSTWILLIAFAFTVMADPISSVAYAIEAALRALDGNLALLWPTMALVIAIIAVITINYHQLIGRFPEGGGAAAAAGTALGEGWAFLPIGALVVDFVLTISISIAASVSAIVAYFPLLAGQSSGLIHDLPGAAEVVRALVAETQSAFAAAAKRAGLELRAES